MARNCTITTDEEKWVQLGSPENKVEEEEEEALSLCDLPNSEENVNQPKNEEATRPKEIQEEFDFRSWVGSVLPEPELCAADDVFFQGQILPLRRHSVSSETGLARFHFPNPSGGITRSESMDNRCYSGGFTSSRSSSIRSLQSSSSGSTSTLRYNYKPPRVRNQFHSHPSPSPQVRFAKPGNSGDHQTTRKSNIWSFFHVGLVQTPEIKLRELRARSNNVSSKSFGSRNSSSSLNSNSSGNGEKKKSKQRFFNINGGLFSGCKCSVNAVDAIVVLKSTSSGGPVNAGAVDAVTDELAGKKTKQVLSRHRTSEWLKQLSLQAGTTTPDQA